MVVQMINMDTLIENEKVELPGLRMMRLSGKASLHPLDSILITLLGGSNYIFPHIPSQVQRYQRGCQSP